MVKVSWMTALISFYPDMIEEIIKLNSNIQELIVKGNKDIDESVEMCERRMRAKETFQRIVYY